MNRKFNIWRVAIIAVVILSALAWVNIFYAVLPDTSPSDVSAKFSYNFSETPPVGPFGDCLADGASGDIYKTPDPRYCLISSGNSPAENLHKFVHKLIVVVPVAESNQKSDRVITSVLPPEVSVESNTNITENPEPQPENICKNKNAGKDGTPLECNAGGGQGKH
jgi:hypothetical protein